MQVAWVDETHLVVRDHRFVATAVPFGRVDDTFVIVKTPAMVRRYLQLLVDESPRRIVELGIKDGGSTALIALVADPELFLAIDLEGEIPPLLAELIAAENLRDRLVATFGLDQGDRTALTELVDARLPSGGIDLVIDDASHVLGPTRTSFEVLFPRLRPGGLYVLEDWSSECIAAAHLARVLPADADLMERVAVVNQVLHILNAPNHELPSDVVATMSAASVGQHGGDIPRTLFERIVEAASAADAGSLDGVAIGRSRPLADLAVELTMICATRPDLIADVSVDSDWVSVRRGPADVPRDDFRLDDAWTDFFGYLS